MLKSNITKEQLRLYLDEYFETYDIPSMFRPSYELVYLDGLKEGTRIDSYINQFYKEYNLLKEGCDPYKAFSDIISYAHPDLKDKTVLELGGGMVPQLGRELAKNAKHVMVVDRNIVSRNNPDNLEAINCRVESYKDLPSADVIVGLLPCESTQHVIDYAIANKKDFLIAFCGCLNNLNISSDMHKKIYRPSIQYNMVEKYEKYTMVRIEEEAPELGNIVVYDSPYQFPNDIIGNKRSR
jgi:hypothetical protein